MLKEEARAPEALTYSCKASLYGETDVLVVGAGPAGLAAALAAARTGARVMLLERFGALGGNLTQALVQPILGERESPCLLDAVLAKGGVKERHLVVEDVHAALLDACREAKVELVLQAPFCDVLRRGNTLQGVFFLGKEGMQVIRARQVVDATGDGDVAFRAGVPYEKGRQGDGLMQPMSIMFEIGGVDKSRAITCGHEEDFHQLPEGEYIAMTRAASRRGELPRFVEIIRIYEHPLPDRRVINATQVNYVDGTRTRDLSRAELEGRRQVAPIVAFLRRHVPGYENAYLSRMPSIIGVRETRRFRGLYQLSTADVLAGRSFPDAVVRRANFVIDIHNPDGGAQAVGDRVPDRAQPYDIPYRCLVPEGVDNLLLSGRCISASHEAHASLRVMWIVSAIGQAAGVAAALCAREGIPPRLLPAACVQAGIKAITTEQK